MGFRIQNNIPALNTRRHLNKNEEMLNRSLQRLSSGYRINSAADDAAGLAASMRFRAELDCLKVASRNASEATSLLQVAEGAMGEINSILNRMKELATQAASGNAGIDLSKINNEVTALEQEISRIVGFTQYDGRTLLDGTFGTTVLSSTAPVSFVPGNGIENIDVTNAKGNTTYTVTAMDLVSNTMTLSDGTISQTVSYNGVYSLGQNDDYVLNFNQLGIRITVNTAFDELDYTTGVSRLYTGATGSATFQVGDKNNANNQIGFALPDLSLSVIANGLSGDVDLSSHDNARSAMDTLDQMISYLAQSRADVGALINRLAYTTTNLSVSIENKTASESVIRDVDMASEMSEYTKANILIQSSVAMLAQANQVPQAVLGLLK